MLSQGAGNRLASSRLVSSRLVSSSQLLPPGSLSAIVQPGNAQSGRPSQTLGSVKPRVSVTNSQAGGGSEVASSRRGAGSEQRVQSLAHITSEPHLLGEPQAESRAKLALAVPAEATQLSAAKSLSRISQTQLAEITSVRSELEKKLFSDPKRKHAQDPSATPSAKQFSAQLDARQRSHQFDRLQTQVERKQQRFLEQQMQLLQTPEHPAPASGKRAAAQLRALEASQTLSSLDTSKKREKLKKTTMYVNTFDEKFNYIRQKKIELPIDETGISEKLIFPDAEALQPTEQPERKKASQLEKSALQKLKRETLTAVSSETIQIAHQIQGLINKLDNIYEEAGENYTQLDQIQRKKEEGFSILKDASFPKVEAIFDIDPTAISLTKNKKHVFLLYDQ